MLWERMWVVPDVIRYCRWQQETVGADVRPGISVSDLTQESS